MQRTVEYMKVNVSHISSSQVEHKFQGQVPTKCPATSSTRENLHGIQNQVIVNLFFMVHSVLFSPNSKISNGTDSSSLQISFMMLLPFIRQDKRVQINKG